MPTLVDSLILEFGLDSSAFTKGQKQVVSDLKTLQENSIKTAKEMENRGKQAAQFFGQIRNQVAGLFAAFTAGKGLKDFLSDLTRSDAALGRTANNLHMTAGQLSAWQGVAERAGGTAGGITNSFKGLTQQFQQLALTGQSAVLPYFRQLGVTIADDSGRMRPLSDIFFDLADKFQSMDPAQAQAFGAGLGIDEDTINVLIKGRVALQEYLAEQEKLGHTNKEDADAARARQSAWRGLAQTSEDLGRKLATALTPALLMATTALTRLSEWAAKHRPLVEALFFGLVVAIGAIAAPILIAILGVSAFTVAIAALVAALGLLYDDWKVWSEGGESAFGDFWKTVTEKWQLIVQTLTDGWKLIKALFTGSSDDIRDAWGNLFKDLVADFNDFVGTIENLAPRIWEAIKKGFGSAGDWLSDRSHQIIGAITGRGATKSAGGSNGSAEQDIAYFQSKGWTRDQAAGIVANVQKESGGNPGAVGDNGNAYGLGQWHPDRQKNFAAWAGHDIRESTRDEQLGFIQHELETTEKVASQKLRDAKSAAEAGAAVSKFYERPGDKVGQADSRGALAAALSGGPRPDDSLLTGAASAASANVAGSTVNNRSSEATSHVAIGSMIIQTQATDADGIADGIGSALQKRNIAIQANTGLQG